MKYSPRLVVEAALASLFAIVFVVTWLVPDWIELVFGADPDGGNGDAEWAIGRVCAGILAPGLCRCSLSLRVAEDRPLASGALSKKVALSRRERRAKGTTPSRRKTQPGARDEKPAAGSDRSGRKVTTKQRRAGADESVNTPSTQELVSISTFIFLGTGRTIEPIVFRAVLDRPGLGKIVKFERGFRVNPMLGGLVGRPITVQLAKGGEKGAGPEVDLLRQQLGARGRNRRHRFSSRTFLRTRRARKRVSEAISASPTQHLQERLASAILVIARHGARNRTRGRVRTDLRARARLDACNGRGARYAEG